MSYLKIEVDDDNKEFVEKLLKNIGFEKVLEDQDFVFRLSDIEQFMVSNDENDLLNERLRRLRELNIKLGKSESLTGLEVPSPTLLFGEWKDADIDPTNYRKQLWERRK